MDANRSGSLVCAPALAPRHSRARSWAERWSRSPWRRGRLPGPRRSEIAPPVPGPAPPASETPASARRERPARGARSVTDMWRRRQTLVEEPPPAAEVTADADTHAPEVKIRAFRIGFVGAIGVLLALLLGGIVGQLGTVILYVALALFLALGLDPVG